jgi:Methyltransferase domain
VRSTTAHDLQFLRSQFACVYGSDDSTDDEHLDSILGLNRMRVESRLSLGGLLVTCGQHRLQAADLSYTVVRDIYQSLDLNSGPGTTLADLGCGYGRIGFFGAILWGQPYHGIELVPQRIAEAHRVQRKLGLGSLRFEVGNVLTGSWPECNHYLLLNSVLPCYLPQIIGRFRQIAAKRNIMIVSLSTSNGHFRSQPWLSEVIPSNPSAALPVNLRLFRSR